MMLAKMRYKDRSWLHNPRDLKITACDELKKQGLSDEGFVIWDKGANPRVITGIGFIKGSDCLSRYMELLKLQSDKGSGILSLPDILPFYAYFKSVELVCDPTPELVTYKFEFVEDPNTKMQYESQEYHIVKPEETLWDISYEYDIPMEMLLELNPEISRTDELTPGERIFLC